MARLVVSTAVALTVAYVTGSPQAGFAAFSATYGVTGFLDPAQKSRGPKLDDLKGTTASYGTPVAQIYGNPRVAGAIVWCSDKQEVANTQEQGGKGGPSAETTTYTYKIDVRILLSANVIGGVRRVWSNGKLVWSAADDADAETLQASADTDAWERMTVYTGAADQMPDPVEEAALGIENCPAYRGRGSVFIEGLNLGGSGYLPNLTFEIGVPGVIEAPPVETFYEVDTTSYGSLQVGSTTYADDSTIYAEKTDASADTITIHGFSAPSTSPSLGTFSVPGMGPGGVTPQRGCGDTDALLYVFGGTLWASYGGEPIDLGLAMGDDDNVAYLIDGSSIWVSKNTDQLYRLSKSGGGVSADNSDAPRARTLAKIGGILYGADTSVASQLIKWNATTLAEIGRYDLAANCEGMLCTDGTYLYDFADDALVRWVDGTDTWETAFANMGQIASYAGTSGELPNPVIRDGYIYITRIVTGVLRTLRAPLTPGMALEPAPLEDVLTELCVRSGIPESYVDFSSCSGQLVRALAVTQVTPARQVMEMLGGAYLQEFVEGAGLKTVARGGASVATLPYDDIGASSGDPVEPLPLKRLNDIELPRQFAITYANVLNDYQNGTEYSDRLLGGSTSVATTELPLGLQPQEAKRIADCKLLDAVAGIIQIGPVGITRAYARLEPTDVITLTDHEGSTFRSRVVKITDDGGLRTLELVQDDASAVNSSAVTDDDYESSSVVRSVSATELELMDIPILRDADNDAGIYAAVDKENANGTWPGAALYRGINETGWTEQVRFTDRTLIGTTTTALAAWDDGAKFDETSSVTVSVGGELSSYTRDAILNGTANGYLIGSEVLYARTATLVSEGVYTLTGLLRGRRGTEWAAAEGAASGSRVVLLKTQGIRRVDFQTGELGSAYDFRAVTFGKALGSAETESITPMGIGLKPFAPVNARASRASTGSITITWSRRTRLGCGFTGSNGITVPLGETAEVYRVVVYADDTFATVKRTLTATSETVTYTAVQQETDFGSVQDEISVRIYQVSASVGNGYPLEVTLGTNSGTDTFTPDDTDPNPRVLLSAGNDWLVSRNGSGFTTLGFYTYDGNLDFASKITQSAVYPYLAYSHLWASDATSKKYVLLMRGQANIEATRKLFYGTLPAGPTGVVPAFMPANPPVGIWWTGSEFRAVLLDGAVWSSATGASWASQGASSGLPAFGSGIEGAYVVKVGSALAMKYGTAVYHCADTDGITWTAATGDVSPLPTSTYSDFFALTGIASNGSRAVLVGIGKKPGDSSKWAIVYTSTDGEDWTEVVAQVVVDTPAYYAHASTSNEGLTTLGSDFLCDLWPVVGGTNENSILEVHDFGDSTLTFAYRAVGGVGGSSQVMAPGNGTIGFEYQTVYRTSNLTSYTAIDWADE